MKTTVYFIRHGTTENNIGGRFQGSSDIPLGEMGHKQAECLGERFADVPLDAVYSSPLSRAWQTAEGVCKYLPLTPIACDDLREINGGLLEGRTNEENNRDYPEVMWNFRNAPAKFYPPEGESAEQVHARMTAAIARIVKENEGRTIAIVSHGYALLCSVCCLDIPFEQLETRILVNASVTCVEYETDGTHKTVLYNDTAHLAEECVFRSPYWKEEKKRIRQTQKA